MIILFSIKCRILKNFDWVSFCTCIAKIIVFYKMQNFKNFVWVSFCSCKYCKDFNLLHFIKKN